MSTKIYTGMKLSIENIWVAEKAIRESISSTFDKEREKENYDLFFRAYVDQLVRVIQDGKYTFPAPSSIKHEAFKSLTKDYKDFGYEKNSKVRVTIYPPLDDSTVSLGMVSAQKDSYHRELLELPFIEDYSYWNHTDGPKELTEEEWGERCENWNRLFDTMPSYHIFQNGLCIDLARESDSFNFDISDREMSLYNGTYTPDVINLVNASVVRKLALDKFGQDFNPQNAFTAIIGVVEAVNDKVSNVQNADELPIPKLAYSSVEDSNAGVRPPLPTINSNLLNEWVDEMVEIIRSYNV